MATITWSTAAKDARMQALADLIDGAGAPGEIHIYDGTPPDPPGGDVTTQVLLATLTLSLPCGTVSGGALTLSPIEEEDLAPASGTATWARLVDGAGAWVADMDVGVTGSGAVIQLNATDIYQGGIVRITSAVIQEA
jgi:hypothetical protein